MICLGCETQLDPYSRRTYRLCWNCYKNSDYKSRASQKNAANRRSYLGKRNPNYRGHNKKKCRCGKIFYRRVSPSQVGTTYHKYCSRDCKHRYSRRGTYTHIYRGIKFRSGWEVQFYKHCLGLGYHPKYEKESFKTPWGYYVPDFWVPELKTYFEVKGFFRTKESKLKYDYFKKTHTTVLVNEPYFEKLGYLYNRKKLRFEKTSGR